MSDPEKDYNPDTYKQPPLVFPANGATVPAQPPPAPTGGKNSPTFQVEKYKSTEEDINGMKKSPMQLILLIVAILVCIGLVFFALTL